MNSKVVLIVGEGEGTDRVAHELKDAGYAIEVCSFAGAPDRLRSDSPPQAAVFDLSLQGNVSALSGLQGEKALKSRTLALLPGKEFVAELPTLNVDDFVVYPPHAGELEARLARLIGQPEIEESSDMLRQGALAIDLAGYRVFVAGNLIGLTFKEYELLRFLASHPNRVYTREALLDKVWGYDYFGGARTVDVHIRRIRSKIETRGHTFIETVRSVGYRFRPSSVSLP